MKTLNELYTEVAASDALKAEFLALKTPEDIVAFAKKNGCDTTLDEIKAFFEEKQKAAGELSEEELEQVAGGKSSTFKGVAADAFLSAFSAGYYCLGRIIESMVVDEKQDFQEGKGFYCSDIFK